MRERRKERHRKDRALADLISQKANEVRQCRDAIVAALGPLRIDVYNETWNPMQENEGKP
jgi:hypothetical protein